MSRRPPPDRAAQNQQTIKALLKLEGNKICADCKRNKHPRWASWNLGVFICIRCSGIHRGMGTHVSRVKSVDLDSWTDEQMQSVLKWGNARANRYWEAKLTPGHVPSEAKIENFIRTKYESKRWVMDGPVPDPLTLGGENDVPSAAVQERAVLERSASQRAQQRVPSIVSQPSVHRQHQPVDLFGDDEVLNPPERPNTTDPLTSQLPKISRPIVKQNKPADSLLGLDFFGNSQPSGNNRPLGTGPNTIDTTGASRPDLKQSILSLYASAPKPHPTSPPSQHDRSPSFGYISSPQSRPLNVGVLTDAFSGLSIPSPAPQPPMQESKPPSNQGNLGNLPSPKSSVEAPKISSPTSSLSGGSLFDSTLSDAPSKPQHRPPSTSSNGINLFSQKTTPASRPKPSPPAPSKDLFDLAPSNPISSSKPKPTSVASTDLKSVFNLSSRPVPKPLAATTSTTTVSGMFSANIDAWGSDAWNTPDPAPSTTRNPSSTMKVPDTLTANDIGVGWGGPPVPSTSKATPTVAADEDFGGWTSASSVSKTATSKSGGGFGGSDDLFSNVWQ